MTKARLKKYANLIANVGARVKKGSRGYDFCRA